MMLTKKEQIQQYVMNRNFKWTINGLHYHLTGVKDGIRWNETIIECSKSTVRRALEELVGRGLLLAWYRVGHCYDSAIYSKK